MADKAILKLYGDIGEPDPMMEMFDVTDETISAKIVSDFLDENKSAKEVIVKINSRGGDVQEGWNIHDLLVNSGKKITTVGEGKVYSIATIIFLAGSTRQMMANADGMIHNPFIPEYTMAGSYEADDLEKIAETMRDEEKKILDLYVERTGSEESKLAEYMKEETKLSADDMLSLGFATEILKPVVAYAYMKPIKSKVMSMTNDEEVKFMDKVGDTVAKAIKTLGLSRVDPVAQTLKDKDGKEFTLEKESGAPAVGDKASPDGTYVMEDGKTITIASGEVSKVDTPAEDKTELEKANEQIETLNQKITDLEAANATAQESVEAANVVKEEGEKLVTELQNLKNSWSPEGRQKNFSKPDVVGRINLKTVQEKRAQRLIDNAKNR